MNKKYLVLAIGGILICSGIITLMVYEGYMTFKSVLDEDNYDSWLYIALKIDFVVNFTDRPIELNATWWENATRFDGFGLVGFSGSMALFNQSHISFDRNPNILYCVPHIPDGYKLDREVTIRSSPRVIDCYRGDIDWNGYDDDDIVKISTGGIPQIMEGWYTLYIMIRLMPQN